MSQSDASVHSGNYYTFGTTRVLEKLSAMGVSVPDSALSVPATDGRFDAPSEFRVIDLAMFDWFADRDYEQAQALLHANSPMRDWYAIFPVDEQQSVSEISPGMLCPSLLDAVGAIVNACELNVERLDRLERKGNEIIAFIGGQPMLRIVPVPIEPFDVAIRDRVRTAFKGICSTDFAGILSRASRLPGFDAATANQKLSMRAGAATGSMLLGFPGNWAFAMRNALEQVGIEVKQSQAQELAAVFFGANSWHQLVKHRDRLNDCNVPVELVVTSPDGHQDSRYFHSTEESLFAAFRAMGAYPEPVVLQHLGPNLSGHRVMVWTSPRRLVEGLNSYQASLADFCIECGSTDYWSLDDRASPTVKPLAQALLESIKTEGTASATDVLYGGRSDARSVLEHLLERDGIPANQVIFLDSCALAVRYVPEPNGTTRSAAKLSIYQFADGRYSPAQEIAMYKADVIVLQTDDGAEMVIKPDYGHESPIRVQIGTLEKARQLFALTHPEHIFTMRRPRFM